MIIHPVLLCGGTGTRLWPLSRKSYPKQFVKLIGDQSLYQATAKRLSGKNFAAPVIVTNADFRFIVIEQLAALEIAPIDILIEPEAKNTAAAICAAALALEACMPGALMLAAPCDHLISDDEAFQQAALAAIPAAKKGQIVTFGIKPARAETGYGWLELSDPMPDIASAPQDLKSFVEKPDLKTAKKFFLNGRHLWNAGIFLFTTTTILAAFKAYAPKVFDAAQAAFDNAEQDLSFTRLGPAQWQDAPDISIDYAIMERAESLSVMPYAGAWSDLGDWQAVWREGKADSSGTVANGQAVALDCHNTLLQATSQSQPLIGIGLKDMIAIAMPDAVLIADKQRAQEVRQVVEKLKDAAMPQAETFPRDYRPWGWYETLASGPHFQVKHIVVHPGAALSLQSHNHRAEHWVVVEGNAKVTVDDEVKFVGQNQSVYIPPGSKHRLENPEKIPLILIEVQTGNYFGEDDIIRYEDLYARDQEKSG